MKPAGYGRYDMEDAEYQREREAKLDMQQWAGKFSSGERTRIAAGALASGFDDQTEYLFSLVLTDTRGFKL